LASSTLVIAASAFTASDFVSELALTLVSTGLSSAFTLSLALSADLTSAALLAAGSDFGASTFASAFDVSLAGGMLAADGVASDTTAFIAGSAARASAVWVCSRNGAA